MSKCTNPEAGDLLHAYELNALSEEDTERFEIHLLECEHCFEQLKSFEREASLLTTDEGVKELIGEFATEGYPQAESFLKKLWRYIWPETPLLFKPALAYLLILLLIIPAYRGLMRLTKDSIRPVDQTILLTPLRSTEEATFEIGRGGDGEISFVFEDAVAGQSYQVAIESEDGRVVYKNDTFREFDAHKTGRLILPLVKMKPGGYRLVISDPRAEPPLNRKEYNFRIEK